MQTTDQGFVAVPPEAVFKVVGDLDRYPSWWSGVRARSGGRLRVPALGMVRVEADRIRPGIGLFVKVDGRRAKGHLEWYLEAFEEGTVVNCFTDLEPSRRWPTRRTRRLRSSIRSAMVGLKSLLE